MLDTSMLAFLAAPFVASLILTGIHAYLGVHVVERGVIFVDLSLAQIAAIRGAIDTAIDFYVESPDDFGGTVRHYETAELVRVGAPIYLTYGLRNAPPLYPSGQHLEPTVVALSRERVRRAAIGLAILARRPS